MPRYRLTYTVEVHSTEDTDSRTLLHAIAHTPDFTVDDLVNFELVDDALGEAAPVIGIIRSKYPNAARFTVSASDQNHYGWVLGTITLDDGSFLDEELEQELDDELSVPLGNLRWGAFGDHSRDDNFAVDMTTGKIIR